MLLADLRPRYMRHAACRRVLTLRLRPSLQYMLTALPPLKQRQKTNTKANKHTHTSTHTKPVDADMTKMMSQNRIKI
eukprot:NODE_2779_length_742_cov_185.825397_g1953_i0.p4 GENE.NODE_2779_length_742_cov_185.825397_g1953_i0~~NODE_2779_length_742_cov_185.825397_g1953_i0.p4  ORF type:complete len:77 (-),score=15.91 NODE_2779_length_742_cov_185.825397_g1953_i0:368-598(-)